MLEFFFEKIFGEVLDQYQLPIRRNFEYLEKNGVFKFFKSLHLQVFRASWISQDHQNPKDPKDMTLAEYLSLPENQNANLVMPLSWCPHLESINKDFAVEDFDVKRPCEVCNNEVSCVIS